MGMKRSLPPPKKKAQPITMPSPNNLTSPASSSGRNSASSCEPAGRASIRAGRNAWAARGVAIVRRVEGSGVESGGGATGRMRGPGVGSRRLPYDRYGGSPWRLIHLVNKRVEDAPDSGRDRGHQGGNSRA